MNWYRNLTPLKIPSNDTIKDSTCIDREIFFLWSKSIKNLTRARFGYHPKVNTFLHDKIEAIIEASAKLVLFFQKMKKKIGTKLRPDLKLTFFLQDKRKIYARIGIRGKVCAFYDNWPNFPS